MHIVEKNIRYEFSLYVAILDHRQICDQVLNQSQQAQVFVPGKMVSRMQIQINFCVTLTMNYRYPYLSSNELSIYPFAPPLNTLNEANFISSIATPKRTRYHELHPVTTIVVVFHPCSVKVDCYVISKSMFISSIIINNFQVVCLRRILPNAVYSCKLKSWYLIEPIRV